MTALSVVRAIIVGGFEGRLICCLLIKKHFVVSQFDRALQKEFLAFLGKGTFWFSLKHHLKTLFMGTFSILKMKFLQNIGFLILELLSNTR